MSRFAAAARLHSLRSRLLAGVCVAVLLLWIGAGWFSYSVAQDEAEELIDANLSQVARLLLAVVLTDETRLRDVAPMESRLRGPIDNPYDPPLEFQIGRGDGTILAKSANAPPMPILGIEGFSDVVRADGAWRLLNLVAPDGRYRVQVAYALTMRDKAAFELSLATVLPLALISPLLVLLIYVSIRAGLRPLERLAAQVGRRNVENLAPLEKDEAPVEALPLVDALNRLLRRLDATLENERRFTSDAAHELRTPLAAVRVQAQVALASTDGAEHQHALRQVLAGAERAARLVEQLLRIARLDPLARLPDPRSVDIVRLAHAAADTFTDASCPRRADLRFDLGAAPVRIDGDADLLDMALRNLIDNALRYTAEGTQVTVVARMEGDDAVLGVKDGGGGVSEQDLPRISERFYRGKGTTAEGSGLGLAIVRRVAELHSAPLETANVPGGGFSALLRWAARRPAG